MLLNYLILDRPRLRIARISEKKLQNYKIDKIDKTVNRINQNPLSSSKVS